MRLTLFALMLVVGGLTAPSAAAFYGNGISGANGAEIVSADFDRLEQGDDVTVFAAISADGRYVAIQTRARNFFGDDDPDPPGLYRAGGIFRFDLQTKALEKVADGDLFDEATNEFVRRGASNPSISADGRYVAFATAEQLTSADQNDHVDVYVRDMTIPVEVSGSFDLVSARDGGDLAASYGPPSFPFPGSEPGADVSRAVAISADGQEVAFRTEAPSDLPASGSVDVPAGQVFVRDRALNTTRLITAVRDSGMGEMTAEPAGGAVGAALSADGSTVAWTGGNAAVQTRFISGENPEPSFLYYLWRRIADGPNALTRRITGVADPDDPACSGGFTNFDQISVGPCYGPLTDQEANRTGISAQLPAISGDGYTVAFVTGSGPRPNASTGTGLDLYLTDMSPGLARKESTVELTRDPGSFDTATSSPLSSIAMSSNGRFVALTTARTNFTLPALQLTSPSRTVPGVRELYVADLQSRTLERVAHSYSGGDVDADVQNGITLSADGGRIAFTSFGGNLFFGDANQRADAFVATRQPDPNAGPLDQAPGEGGAGNKIVTDRDGPQIGVRAKSKAGGTIVLTVSVPAAGGIKAVGRAQAGTPRKLRTIAIAVARAKGPGRSEVHLTLKPVRRYLTELRERESIPGRALVSYVSSQGGRRASTSVRISFTQGASPKSRPKRGRK